MLYEGTRLAEAIEAQLLPPSLEQLFGDLYDADHGRFLLQETTLLDFKETIPNKFADGYGAGIVRLALALHNTYGGLIVFGIADRTLTATPTTEIFNIEAFNRFLSDVTDTSIECVLRRYAMKTSSGDLPVQVVLVPRRGQGKPCRLTRALGKYPAGTLWVRDRHEVLEARSDHLPLLYSERGVFLKRETGVGPGIHRSLPSSPATMEEFIGRWELMVKLWDWVTTSDQPRLYLYGPGGCGKSTLAYAFARDLAEAPQPVRRADGTAFDYVVYLSGKESAFDPLALEDAPYRQRDFSNAAQQYVQILYHSGLASEGELKELSADETEKRIVDLFANFSGLIVVDDIDALSRRGEDTGEELLFLKAVQTGGRTRILYTSRYAPPYALRNALEVPGLKLESEFFPFVEACCDQFEVPRPNAESSIAIAEETDKLPLLIETIIGLRRTCTAYKDAIRLYKDREGDAARRYLYQREYDKLEARGKSRQVLCALAAMEGAISSTNIAHVTSLSESQVRDAITETRGIFLRTSETDGGDTLYSATQSSLYFLQEASRTLPFYSALHQAVKHFKRQSTKTTPYEAAVITSLTGLARNGQFTQMIEQAGSISKTDPIQGNPRFLGLVGQAYANLGGARSEDARECFRRAFALHDRDVFMLRAWYRLEFGSPNGTDAAEQLCRSALDGEPKLERRYSSEFYSKLGQILEVKSRQHVYTNRERAVSLLKDSISAYFEGAWIGGGIRGLDKALQLEWLTGATQKLYSVIGNEIDHVFHVIEAWADTGHDVDVDAARIIVEPLRRAAAVPHPASRRIAGLARKASSKFSKSKAVRLSSPGFAYVNDTLLEVANSQDASSRSN